MKMRYAILITSFTCRTIYISTVFSAFHCTCTVTQRTINPAVEVPNVHKLL